VETFVLNWDGDLYGDVVRVRFLYRLRDERKFSSVDELTRQIKTDVARAESYFEHAGTKHMLSVI
jgi:riboflavin kinase/FMN adenylyltransferase